MSDNPVHTLTRTEIKRLALAKRAAGEYYDITQPQLEDNFRGSIDRFCDIAYAFRACPRVVDVGSGDGLLIALLTMLGHEAHAVDLLDRSRDPVYLQHQIPFRMCNVEADPLPFPDATFDALSCCQAFEHFTHSHLAPLAEMKRVLKTGGLIEIDVPNVASFRNRSRMLRGKNITYDYRKHYLYEQPIVYKDREYYPGRHNREFTRAELELLLREAGFHDIDARFLKSRRYRPGLEGLKSIGTAIKDAVPSLRKSLIAFGRK